MHVYMMALISETLRGVVLDGVGGCGVGRREVLDAGRGVVLDVLFVFVLFVLAFRVGFNVDEKSCTHKTVVARHGHVLSRWATSFSLKMIDAKVS